MANYSANIQLVVQGQDRLKFVLNSVEKLNTILSRLKPINLLAPGRGAGADVIGQAKKQLDDFSRAIVNFKPEGIQKRAKELSNTLAGSAAQADALTIALENVGLKTGGFSRQAAEVKNYALALEQARRNTERLNAISQQVQRGARVQTIAERFNVSPITVEERLNGLRNARYAKDRKAEAERFMALKREEDFELRLQRIRERNAAAQATQAAQLERNKAMKGRLGGALSNAAIGGAFPLLFGQGAGAATGGAIGGLIGGAFGGTGGFAGSLIGTLLGDIASRGQAVKQLAEDIGFSAQQTKQLSEAFKVANTDIEKFTAVIQNIRGIGLELEDQAKAVQLVTRLTELYGGSFEKTGNAITSALESGKVTQATLNQLTSQGINIQQALADKFDVNRDAILKMAKDGKISVQSLIDTLVDLGNAPGKAAKQTQTASQLFQTAIQNLTKVVGPELERLASLFLNFGATALNALTSVLTRLGQVGTAIENRIAGKTLTNAQQQFRRDAATLKGLYATPKEQRTEQQVQQITALERLQKGRMQVIEAAQPQKPEKLESFPAPSQAAPSGGGGRTKAPKERESRIPELQIELELAQKIAALNLRIAEAKDKGNRTTEHALEMDKILEERSAAIAKINLQDIPVTEKNLQTQIATVQANEKLNQIIIERNRISKEAVSTAEKALADSQKEIGTLQVKRDRQAEYAKLIREGVLPANAENYLQTKELVKEALKSAEAAIVEAEARGASADEVDRLRKNLEAIRGAGQTEIDKAKTPEKGATITDAITKAKGELNELLDMENQVVAAAQAIGDAFSQAFQGLVSGAMTGQEALAAFFKGVGDHFLDMASKMIAKLIEIYILETVLGFITGAVGGGGGGVSGGGGGGPTSPAFAPPAVAAEGAYWSGGFQAFANGGMVNRPTLGLVGEGGEPEYIIPASKMRSAMGRYASGARGASVIPGNGGPASSENGGGVATMEPIDVRYSIERINNVDYVTADQFQAGMAQAAQQGAIQGERRAMRSLKNSSATRRGVGI